MAHAAGERPAGGSAHRWSTGYSHHGTRPVTLVPLRVLPWEWERRVGLVAGVDTLLGPEGTGVLCLCLQAALGLVSHLVGGAGVLGVQAGPAAIPHLVREGLSLRVCGCWWWLWVGAVRVLRTA
jgi:hypothetical protein